MKLNSVWTAEFKCRNETYKDKQQKKQQGRKMKKETNDKI